MIQEDFFALATLFHQWKELVRTTGDMWMVGLDNIVGIFSTLVILKGQHFKILRNKIMQ